MSTRSVGIALLSVVAYAAYAGEVKGRVVNVRGGEALRQVQVSIAERHLTTATHVRADKSLAFATGR
jgi:hypothetical protein